MFRGAALLLLTFPCSVGVALDRQPEFIEGRVLDAAGRPVVGVDVSSYWSANGWQVDASGKVAFPPKSDDLARFWANVGQMEPTSHPVKSASDGTFRVQVSNTRTHHVLALDADRRRGGLGIVPVGKEGHPITVMLEPLVRVRGQIRGPESTEKPPWTHIYTMRAEEPERPVDFYRVAGCGSYDADFAMLLPPGHYQFSAYNEELTAYVQPDPRLTITGSEGEIDLGTLRLTRVPEGLVPRMTRVMAEKHIPSLQERLGQSPPPVFADDSKGIARDWQPGRATGKWQVIEFWGMDCPACLSRILPDLIRFQEEHAAQADRFEIVSVFMDIEGKITTITKMDEALKPIIKHVWGGKTLPFPTILDATYRTSESWGLAGYGDMVLINPEGKIVQGDLDTLRAILDKK